MNGFSTHGLDEDAFGEKTSGGAGLRTFDAFRMSTIVVLSSLFFLSIPAFSSILNRASSTQADG